MYCMKCGHKLPDGSKFCQYCGSEQTDFSEVPEPAGQTGASPSPEESESEKQDTSKKDGRRQDQKKIILKWIGITGGVLLLILAAVLTALGISASRNDNTYACLADGEYALITNIKKGKTIPFDSARGDETGSWMLSFSPDGRYVYYYTKFDGTTGTLCRGEYDKFKKNAGQNSQYIDIIASEVKPGFQMTADGIILYQNKDSAFYCYDGNKAHHLEDEVLHYALDESGRMVYATYSSGEGYLLCGYDLHNPDEKIEIDFCSEYFDLTDPEHILYGRGGTDTWFYPLYEAGISKKPRQIAENIRGWKTPNGEMCILRGDKCCKLQDLIKDPYMEQDAAAENPSYTESEFWGRYSEYQPIEDPYLFESDYYGYTMSASCTQPAYWFELNGYGKMSISAAANSSTVPEQLRTEAAAFVEKYKSREDSQGYFPVESDVEDDLRMLADCVYHLDSEYDWMTLAFSCWSSQVVLDDEKYDTAWKAWDAASARNELRSELQENEWYDVWFVTPCSLEAGTLKPVSDQSILSWRQEGDALLFYAADPADDAFGTIDELQAYVNETGKSVLEYCETRFMDLDVHTDIEIIFSGENKVYKMSPEVFESYAKLRGTGEEKNQNVIFRMSEAGVYLYNADSGQLFSVIRSGNEITDFELIADEAVLLDCFDTGVYYLSGMYEQDGVCLWDLFVQTREGTQRVAQDILANRIVLYADGTAAAYTDYDADIMDGDRYELTLFDPAEGKIRIADDVTRYARTEDGTLLYLADGNLCRHTEEGEDIILPDVDEFWVLKPAEVAYQFPID